MDSIYNLQKKLSSPELVSMQKTLNTVHAQLRPYYDNVEYMSGFQHLAGEMSSLFANMIETSGYLEAQSSLAAIGDRLKDFLAQNYMFDQDTSSVIKAMSERLSQIILPMYQDESIIKLHEVFRNIPDFVFDAALDGTEYTRQDVEEEVESFSEETSNLLTTKELNPKMIWQYLCTKYPILSIVLARIVFIIKVTMGTAAFMSAIDSLVLPIIQTAIVHLQGKEDICFIKGNSARIYVAPDSHSAIITTALYGDEICKLEDAKMWVKVSYENTDGETVIGWIAKRNLMPYRDFEFNSDKLYE